MQHWTSAFGLKKARAKQDSGLSPLCLGICTERNNKVSQQGKKTCTSMAWQSMNTKYFEIGRLNRWCSGETQKSH